MRKRDRRRKDDSRSRRHRRIRQLNRLLFTRNQALLALLANPVLDGFGRLRIDAGTILVGVVSAAMTGGVLLAPDAT